MKNKGIGVVVSMLLILGLLLGSLGCPTSTTTTATQTTTTTQTTTMPEEKVAKIGFLGALTGPASLWGLPGYQGLQILVDDINAEGGMVVGEDVYKLELIAYDDQMIPTDSLVGARKLVLEDGIVALFAPIILEPALPFINEHKIVSFVMNADNLGPDRPYVIAANGGTPEYEGIAIEWLKNNFPDLKTMSVASQDDAIGKNGVIWAEIAAEAVGIEVVYSKIFTTDVIDFAPLTTAMLAPNPDIVDFGQSWPGFTPLMMEQAKIQGFEGVISVSSWDLPTTLSKVGPEYMEATFGLSKHPGHFDDPMLSEESHQFYKRWVETYGADQWQQLSWLSPQCFNVWKQGVELAGTVESTAVRDALVNASTIDTTFGPGRWWGEEMYGINQYLWSEKWPIVGMEDGREKILAWGNIHEWWAKYGDIAIRHYEEAGLLWYQ